MKVVILAGGLGTRISEESHLKPKPMIEIGEKPILWHIMKHYSHYGFNEFIVCAGYKQHVIKEWFADYYLHNSDITFDFTNHNEMVVHNNVAEPWKVTIVDTGLNTMTGGRIKRIEKYIGNEPFMLTYGDAISNVNIDELLEFHNLNNGLVTLTAVNLGQDKGVLDISSTGKIEAFREKSDDDGAMINAGFMVCNPKVISYIETDNTIFEKDVLSKIANIGELMAYRFDGFWQCMDTQRDKNKLEELWQKGGAPWKIWE